MPHSILDAIGHTPLVEIRRLNPHPGLRILAKLEYFNPGGSVKDRPARYMLEAAERSGELTPAKTVIEATSGNTGIDSVLNIIDFGDAFSDPKIRRLIEERDRADPIKDVKR
jgi:hypothetical protein